MIKRTSFHQLLSFFTILLLCFSTGELTAQCQQFVAVVLGEPDCDDNGTSNDPSDDTYTVEVYISNDLNPSNTWSSSDGSYTNENYPFGFATFQFGPYLISNGNVTVTFTDDQDGCTETLIFEAPEPCSGPPFVCPDFDLCYSLFSSTNCTATYAVSISGDLDGHVDIGPMLCSWFPSSGIDNIAFFQANSYLENNGVTLGSNSVSGGTGMDGTQILNSAPHFLVTVSAAPGDCVSLTNSSAGGMIFDGVQCILVDDLCTTPAEFCATGVEITGNVTAPGYLYDCPDTENHGIEGAEVSITTDSGETCETETENDGSYSCIMCDDGPYTICINTVCEDPCGVTDLDLFLLREYILGIKAWTKEILFIGDVSGDGSVSTLDLVLIQRELLGLDTDRIENWCRFVPVQDFVGVPEPSSATTFEDWQMVTDEFAAVDNCITTDEPWISRDFVRLMLGDVDGSCTDCVHGDEMGDLPIVIGQDKDDKNLFINAPMNDVIYGLSLKFDLPKGVQVNEVNSVLPGMEYVVRNGEVHILWVDLTEENQGYFAKIGTPLVTITTSSASSLKLKLDQNFILSKNQGITRLSERKTVGNGTFTTKKEQGIWINGSSLIYIPEISGEGEMMIQDLYGRIIYETPVDQYTASVNYGLKKGVYILTTRDEYDHHNQKIFVP